jgi:hypothetical protein
VEIQMPEWLAEEKGCFDGQGFRPYYPDPEPESSAPEETGGPGPDENDPADDAPAEPRAFGDNVKWLKTETITYSTPLTEKEKAAYAENMAALDEEIEDLEEERAAVSSSLKKKIDGKEQERRALAKIVRTGNEEREARCDCLKDYNAHEMVWCETEPPYAELMRRKMTQEEMQPTLLEFESKPAATPAQAEVANTEEEAGPETITLYGHIEGETETSVNFLVYYNDNTQWNFEIPREQLIDLIEEEDEDGQQAIIISRAYALEHGLISPEAPGEEATEELSEAAGQ